MSDRIANDRIDGLDALRALAILLVIAHHTGFRFEPHPGDWLGKTLHAAGWIGVDIFFVISGFLITKVLLRRRGDIRDFLRRRVFRIAPLLVVAVAFYAALSATLGLETEALRNVWSPALLLNGWTIPFFGSAAIPYTITWSLSVEEAAYLTLGVSSFAIVGGLRIAAAGMIVTAVATRAAILEFELIPLGTLQYFVPARVDGIGLGALAALGVFAAVERKRVALVLAAAGMLIFLASSPAPTSTDALTGAFRYTAFGLVVAVLVACLAARSAGSLARLPGLSITLGVVALFGKYSYFIYLFHMFVLEGLRYMAALLSTTYTFWQAVALTSVITFAGSAVSWRYFEYPLIVRGRSPVFRRSRSEPPNAVVG